MYTLCRLYNTCPHSDIEILQRTFGLANSATYITECYKILAHWLTYIYLCHSENNSISGRTATSSASKYKKYTKKKLTVMIESIDSICRNSTEMQYMVIQKLNLKNGKLIKVYDNVQKVSSAHTAYIKWFQRLSNPKMSNSQNV